MRQHGRFRKATLVLAAMASVIGSAPARAASPDLPARLSETGLYADIARKVVRPENLPYAPQYPLWTDDAEKRRWIYLPPGTVIDAGDPDRWVFPVGTKLWKEFSFGRRVETRFLERTDEGWAFASYVWNADESDAELAPERGLRSVAEVRPGVRHDIPSRWDCRSCHEGSPQIVLGFGTLQLSSDRDPLAPHAGTPPEGALDLAGLVARGLVVGLPDRFLKTAPRITATTPRERAVLGYLHGNCGHCHNGVGPLASLGLDLSYPLASSRRTAPAIRTAVNVPSHVRLSGTSDADRIAPGDPQKSVLVERLGTRNPYVQMPPLGTHLVDDEALELVTSWIREDLASTISSH